jgi:hypothetical protein
MKVVLPAQQQIVWYKLNHNDRALKACKLAVELVSFMLAR